MKKIIFLFLLGWSFSDITAQPILTEREQSKIIDEILEERFEKVLPNLMKRTGIDCWLLIAREYNEDPVLKTMLPSTWLSARRTTMLLFYLNPTTNILERYAIARYNVGNAIQAAWDLEKFPDQWDALADLIQKKNPERIGINISKSFGHADGLDHTHYVQIGRAHV